MTKIKILKDTPFDLKGTEIDLSEFKSKYGYITRAPLSDEALLDSLKFKSHPILNQTADYCVSDWFKVIEDKPKFKVGDWVWHQGLSEAFEIILPDSRPRGMRPNECTINAVNENPQIYQRLATSSEIDNYTPRMFGERILVNRRKVYHFDVTWSMMRGVEYNLQKYFNLANDFGNVSKTIINETVDFKVKPLGLKIGCTEIEHSDLIKIAHLLYMKV